jgi:hypothetical protein
MLADLRGELLSPPPSSRRLGLSCGLSADRSALNDPRIKGASRRYASVRLVLHPRVLVLLSALASRARTAPRLDSDIETRTGLCLDMRPPECGTRARTPL